MTINTLLMVSVIAKIETSIAELQKSHILLQEQLKTDQKKFESNLNEAIFKIIDILDMITLVESNACLHNSINTQTTIKKIEKMLVALLRHLKVEEITFKDNQAEASKIRVLETKEVSEQIPAATIIEVCRKGYQRDGKTIRPADVITTASNKINRKHLDC